MTVSIQTISNISNDLILDHEETNDATNKFVNACREFRFCKSMNVINGVKTTFCISK